MKTLALAINAAEQVGNYLLDAQSKIGRIDLKDYKDIVTEHDKHAEAMIIKLVRRHFPHHAIFSEEIGRLEGHGPTWVIDPIDGTINFVHQQPLYSVSIGIVEHGMPLAGVVFAPSLGEFWVGERGQGATRNGKPIIPSQTDKIEQAIIHTGMSAHYAPKLRKQALRLIGLLSNKTRGPRMLESGAITSCYVADGRLDGKISIKTDPFGNAASTLIIEEAGGKVSDGEGTSWSEDMKTMICSNRVLHGELLALYKKSTGSA